MNIQITYKLLLISVSMLFACTVNHKYPKQALPITHASGNIDLPINGELGKCYAKCLIPNTYEPRKEIYILYTGIDKENNPLIEKRILELYQDDKTKGNETKLYENIHVVKDTQQCKEFILREFTVNKIVKLGGFTEWQEILCRSKITEKLVLKVQDVLTASGYLKDHKTGILDRETKDALLNYQKVNTLPTGHLDKLTLKRMTI